MAREIEIPVGTSKVVHFDVDGELIVWTDEGAVLSYYPSVDQLREIKAWASELLNEAD